MTGLTFAKLTAEQRADLVRRYEGGWGTKECGDWLGVDTTTVGNWLKKLGVEMRPRGGGPGRPRGSYGSCDPTAGGLISPAAIMDMPRLAYDDGRRWM